MGGVEGVRLISFCKFCKSSGKKGEKNLGICVTCPCTTPNVSIPVPHGGWKSHPYQTVLSFLGKPVCPRGVCVCGWWWYALCMWSNCQGRTVGILKVVSESGKKTRPFYSKIMYSKVVTRGTCFCRALVPVSSAACYFCMLKMETNNQGNLTGPPPRV